jgi:hypothetical protein
VLKWVSEDRSVCDGSYGMYISVIDTCILMLLYNKHNLFEHEIVLYLLYSNRLTQVPVCEPVF